MCIKNPTAGVGCSGPCAPNKNVAALRLVLSFSFDVFALEVVVVDRTLRALLASKECCDTDGRRYDADGRDRLGRRDEELGGHGIPLKLRTQTLWREIFINYH